MGLEAETVCHWQGRSAPGRALLESDHLLFRGGFRLKLMLAGITSVAVEAGCLCLTVGPDTAKLELGSKAEAWEARIRQPRTLADKLGLKPGDHVLLLGMAPDPVLAVELARAGTVAIVEAGQASDRDPDWIILTAATEADLELAATAARRLAANSLKPGAIWVVFPKGSASMVPQGAVFQAFRGQGLVDTKTCAVSAVSTALKFVRRTSP